ncbi:MAG: tetratricopeptide repeat protein [Treponema sp.]|jgi:tetratricopeptide (TPR) repeat protein|nr:tetratricopeptide repeat protein [Treponema sp.]
MPSLQDLKQFKDIFGKIGHEKTILEAEGIKPDNYELPSAEPLPRTEPDAAPEEAAPEDAAPEEVAPKEAAPEDAATQSSEETQDEEDAADDSIFGDVFDGFSDLITDVPDTGDIPADTTLDTDMSTPEPPAAESNSEPAADDFSGIDDFNLTPPIEENAAADNGEQDAGEELNLEHLLDGFDTGGDSADNAEDENFSIPDDIFNDNSSDTPDNDFDFPVENSGAESSFDIPSIPDTSEEEQTSSPKVDDAPVTEPAATDTFSAVPETPDIPEPPVSPVNNLENLPGLDDFLPPIESIKTQPAPEPYVVEKSKKPVEAISLTDEQLQQLLETIASYPLNLRIACEKIIVEEIVEPALLSQFIKLLIRGGNAREAAALAGKIQKTKISLPKSYKTGEELEAEQASFAYIFVNKIFPVLRFSMVVAALAASVAYLSYEFIYKPIRASMIYKNGYERITEGEFGLGNRRFEEAFRIHRDKKWFYRYAELFRDERQYLYAEEKYDELLFFYPQDKKGALDYAAMESEYLRNYEKADRLVRTNILDYKFDDREGLLALGDINLAWGEYEPARYEEARLAYAKLLATYGQTDPIMERMLLYFIRTDKLGEVIPLQNHFMKQPKSKIAAATLAELGGYLLDKRFEVVKGVPDEHIEEIEGIRDVLLRAGKQDFSLPEVHYHLARYYNNYGATLEERYTLETAASAFDAAKIESPKRTRYRVDTQRRLARLLMADREFLSAEEALAKGVNIMEDAIERRVTQSMPEFGELYAYLGDLSYFAKSGDMREAVNFYINAEKTGWSPPEMQYRLGSAYYRLGEYAPAMNRFFNVSMETPYNRRLLNALGNASYMRSDYFAAEGYFKRLINMLESDRNRFPILVPHERPEHREIVERMMVARNNLGVTYNALAARTGNPAYRASALGEFAESARAWDTLERNPQTMIRAGITDAAIPGASLPYLNIQNTLYPAQGNEGLLFMQIDKDLPDNSWWEELMGGEGQP